MSQRDRRYGSQHWRKLSDRILGKTKHQRRPIYKCYVQGCDRIGDRADHIVPTSLATPDHEFFNPAGLRPACWAHNRARAWFGPEFDEPTEERPRSRLTVPFKPPRVW